MTQVDSSLLQLRLRQIRWEAEGIASYEFVSAQGLALPAFSAGSHIDLHLPRAMVRSYSLLNDPAETHRYVIAVQRDAQGRGGSAWMHQTPRVGDLLRAIAPSNDFPLADSAAPAILIAGGIGITPVVAMLRRLHRLKRPWQLHYAAKSPQQAAFVSDLSALTTEDEQLSLHYSSEPTNRLDIVRIVHDAPPEAHLYCCGPPRMIEAFLGATKERPAAQVHLERFAASSVAATAGGYEVVLQRSGRRLAVAEGKTILDTLLDGGIDVQYSCSVGVCGTRQTKVLAGTPDHRDDYLSDDEKAGNETIMVCCSGSRSQTLVLDL